MKIKYKLIGNDFAYKKIKFYGNVLKISNDSIDINGKKFYLIIGSIQSNNINNISALKKGMTVEVRKRENNFIFIRIVIIKK